MDGKFLARTMAALLLIAVIAAIAFFAYNAGVAQGSPVTVQAPGGETAVLPYPYYGHMLPFHRPFGFGFFGVLIILFFLFLAVKAFSFAVWGPRWRHLHGHGPWEAGLPPMFEEWHRRAHGEQAEKESRV
jgi:hypothetical protein